MKNILIVGAHFDDVELGAGGSAAKWVREGKKVYKLTLTDNVTNFAQYAINVEYEKTMRESSECCKLIGMIEIKDFSPMPCNKLIYSTEIMQRVEKVIFENNIDTIVIHYPYDANQDHVEASKICLTAGRHCKNILFFKSNGYVSVPTFSPNYFVDISDFIELKKQALNCYNGANNRFGRLFETCIENNHSFGYSNNVQFAEGFQLLKILEK